MWIDLLIEGRVEVECVCFRVRVGGWCVLVSSGNGGGWGFYVK